MSNNVESFRRQQLIEGTALAETSDIFSLTPVSGDPPFRYLLEFDCAGLACVGGAIVPANHFVVGVTFGPDHLRQDPNPAELITFLLPEQVWAPNLRPPFACLGPVARGTGLVELAHRLYEVISYQRLTPVEDDALNKAACVWSRDHMDLFPLDTRPLRRPPTQSAAPRRPVIDDQGAGA